ncbi:LYPD6 protein, partial [Calcarius ornatus]|nr:LYPD6 protein [Calcarius ornatus]
SATPYPHGFKCFTCEKASDNYECNRWAPDVYCPRGNQPIPTQWSPFIPRNVGFWSSSLELFCLLAVDEVEDLELFPVCTSCCEGSICNLPLPRNASDAVFATLAPLSAAAAPPAAPAAPALGLGLLA